MFPSDNELEAFFSMESTGQLSEGDSPFHILCLGNWSGNGERSDLDKRRPREIDRDIFDDVLRKVNPTIELKFDSEKTIRLSISAMDDFHPDNIFQQATVFRELRELRHKLKNTATFKEAAAEVRSWFTDADYSNSFTDDESPIPANDDLLELILREQPSDKTQKPNNFSSQLSQFIGDIVKPHLVEIDLAAQADLFAAVDKVVSDIMRKILHHKDFIALEAAWRGLFFLVRRTDTSSNLKIFFFDISQDELVGNLKSVNSLSESVYFQWTQGEDLQNFTGEFWAAVIGNYEFSPNVDDVATLMRISQIGAVSKTPFISHIRPEVLVLPSSSDFSASLDWTNPDLSAEWKLWNILRASQNSEFLGIVTPCLLGRLPYGINTDPLELFAFEEFEGTRSQFVWINPAFVCGYFLGENFRLNGWRLQENVIWEITGLPVYVCENDGETLTQSSAEFVMTQADMQVLINAGIIPLLSFRDSERIVLGSFQSLAVDKNKISGRWN